jgi:uncharacterized membrane protein
LAKKRFSSVKSDLKLTILAAAKVLQSKIHVDARKRRILECLEDEWLTERLTTDPSQAHVHVVSMAHLTAEVILISIPKR